MATLTTPSGKRLHQSLCLRTDRELENQNQDLQLVKTTHPDPPYVFKWVPKRKLLI